MKSYIFLQIMYNFVIKIVIKSMNNNVPDEKAYKELYAAKSKQGKVNYI